MDNVDCSKLQQEALERCDFLIQQYLAWKKQNFRRSTQAQASALIFTAVIPVILLLTWDYKAVVGAAFSALAAIATGLLVINGWRENFIRYGYIYHMPQVEKSLYKARAASEYPDKDPAEATKNFVRRVEGLVTLDVTEWRTEMQRLQDRSK